MQAASPKRLYIITGKGGVGKTTLARAFTRWLCKHGHDATYVTFSSPGLTEPAPILASQEGDFPQLTLETEESAEGYIAQKMGSPMIAHWIVKTPFFRALVNMLPGFGYVILMGKLLEMIQASDNKRIMVLDAPSSGHALTMLEAAANFREIFQSGVIFEDTGRMLQKLRDPTHTAIRILTLPTQMAMHEALELREAVARVSPVDCALFLNHALVPWEKELTEAQAPATLMQKIRLEKEVVDEASQLLNGVFPFSPAETGRGLMDDLEPILPGIV